MARHKLTSAFCRDVTCPPNKKNLVVRCTEQTGFGIEVRPASKTYWQYCPSSEHSAQIAA